MKLSLSAVKAWYETPLGRKAVRYSMASVVAVLISQGVLLLTYGILQVGSAVECNVIATACAALPSYYMNRAWAWEKSGKSHLTKEIIPFWVLAFIGLAVSLWSVSLTENYSKSHGYSHLLTSIAVNFASLAAFGVVWVAKFVIFEKLVFIDHSTDSSDGNGGPGPGISVKAGAETHASPAVGREYSRNMDYSDSPVNEPTGKNQGPDQDPLMAAG